MVKVPITADQGQGMLKAEGGNPSVIGRNGCASFSELGANRAIGDCGSLINVENAKFQKVFG